MLFGTAPAGTARHMLSASSAEAKDRHDAVAEELSMLLRRYPPPIRRFSAYLPVLERTAGDGEGAHGLLRTVSLMSLARAQGPGDELSTNILVYGTAQSQEALLGRPLRAARAVAAEYRLGSRSFPLSGQLLFDRADSLHEGSSSDLALAALLMCAILELAGGRESVGLADDTAMTGIVDDQGTVKPVDARALTTKVAAAFFSPAQCLVVPRSQQEEAERARNALQRRYPARLLGVVGVAHVRELLYDRRVTLRETISLPQQAGRGLWKLRRPLAGVLVLVLAALSFRLWYGPLDRNAVYFEAIGTVLRLYNASGGLVRTVEVGRGTAATLRIERVPGVLTERIAELADLDGDGRNELIWAQFRDAREGVSEIRCENVEDGTLLWRTPLQMSVAFPRSPDVVTDWYYPRLIRTADVNADGRPEIYALALHEFFPALLLQIDPDSGTILAHYLHTGHLHDIRFLDMDGDGTQEILLTGVNNAFREPILAVLDHTRLSGRSPTTPRYEPAGHAEAEHIAYLRFPSTVVGEAFRSRTEFGVGTLLKVDATQRNIKLAILDVWIPSDIPEQPYRGYIYAWLDFGLQIRGYSSDTFYDQTYDLLLESGRIPPVDRAEYLQHHVPKPLYYDAGRWQQSPVVRFHPAPGPPA
jgi:hypothetical protein